MTTEVRSNGSTAIHLSGDRPIERQAIAEILEAASKGQQVHVADGGNGVMVISIEHETR